MSASHLSSPSSRHGYQRTNLSRKDRMTIRNHMISSSRSAARGRMAIVGRIEMVVKIYLNINAQAVSWESFLCSDAKQVKGPLTILRKRVQQAKERYNQKVKPINIEFHCWWFDNKNRALQVPYWDSDRADSLRLCQPCEWRPRLRSSRILILKSKSWRQLVFHAMNSSNMIICVW